MTGKRPLGFVSLARCALGLALALLLCLPAAAQQFVPAKGMFLIAAKGVNDPVFQRSVVLLTDYSKGGGASGLIINKPTDMQLADTSGGEAQPKVLVDKVHMGGPVEPRAIFVLARTNRAPPSMQQVVENVFLAMGIRAAAHIALVLKPGEAMRAYAGYSGWGPGQLEAEIARGDWLVVPADLDQVFTEDSAQTWETLMRAWSGRWI